MDALTEVMDELVHEMAAAQAASINNSGFEDQLKYLMARGHSVETLIKTIVHRMEGVPLSEPKEDQDLVVGE